MNVESFVTFCAEQKLDAVDLLDSVSYPWCWNGYAGKRADVARKVAAAGLKIAAYATGNNFAQTSDAEFSKNVEKVRSALAEAVDVGAPMLRIFGGYHPGAGGDPAINYVTGFQRVLQGIEACLPEAEKQRVVLALENHGRLPGVAYEIVGIINHFRSPWLRVTFDVANFIANNMDEVGDPLAAFSRVAPFIAHVHVKDMGLPVVDKSRRIEACVAGKGVVPLRQFMAALDESGYAGFSSLEYEAAAACPEEQGVPQSLAYLREISGIPGIFKSHRASGQRMTE